MTKSTKNSDKKSVTKPAAKTRATISLVQPNRRTGSGDKLLRQRELLTWYAAHGRDLPWRRTRNPYQVLVAEIMLQQTQVDRVIPFYHNFLSLFPNEKALAAATTEAIHRAWKGLGYPSRVERLRAACQKVLELGAWPNAPDSLVDLPGIGPYTSGSVSVFAFGHAVSVVDTNVARVYARRDGLTLPLNKLDIWRHAGDEVSHEDPIAYTNALMDLGATVCTARNPNCSVCPWQQRCVSRDVAEVHAQTSNPLKVASAKTAYGVDITDRKKPRLQIVLALVHQDGNYLIAKRPKDKHQGGVWEIPGGKREKGEDDRVALARELLEETGLELMAARPLVTFNHDYGDRYVTLRCYRCRVFNAAEAKPLASDALRWVTPEEIVTLTFPPANVPLLERLREYHRIKG